jgi:toluene monooxygenase system ferredoxin subunit
MTFREVMKSGELWSGELRALELDGTKVLLLRTDAGIFAYEDRCVHLGVPLSEGSLRGRTLTCRAHHYTYDAETGRGENPRNTCLQSFPVRVEAGAICVDVSPVRSVGPVLCNNGLGQAIVRALREQNPEIEVLDRGAYLRVLARGHCELRSELVRQQAGAEFELPNDLESVMPAFDGYLRIDGESASWSDRP